MAVHRYPWEPDFSPVWIHAAEARVKGQRDYRAAKAGDSDAAFRLVRGLILHQGGRVVGATVLTGKEYSAILRPEEVQLVELREKHGQDLEKWWEERFGFGYECLTRSEAHYLLRTPTADRIRDRIAAANEGRDRRTHRGSDAGEWLQA